MLIVGCDTRRTSESCQFSSLIQRETPSAFFVVASFRFGDCVLENLPQRRRHRPHLVEEAVDSGCVTVGFNERVQRLHEMPRRAVDLRGKTRVDVLPSARAPTSLRWTRAPARRFPSRRG